MHKWFLGIGILLAAWGCSPRSDLLEPSITYTPQVEHINSLPSAFPELSSRELHADWAKELLIGQRLSKELDLYRGITCFKRAEILFPKYEDLERLQQIQYGLFLSYYLGGRYQDALNIFEDTQLSTASVKFPAIGELLLAIFDSYMKTDQFAKAGRILELIDLYNDEAGTRLRVGDSILLADLPAILENSEQLSCGRESLQQFIDEYQEKKLSVWKAQALNAFLPGAGYYYVGQKKAALTSLVINTVFTAATVAFFKKGNWPAGLITGSLELGWYVGGINGAGLAAKEYNEYLYNQLGKESMIRNRLFPVLQFETAF